MGDEEQDKTEGSSERGGNGALQTAGLTGMDAWNIARAMIEHEDTLVHHRMTHCLSIEAFFFTVAGLSLKEMISTDIHKNKIIWTAGIFAISIISIVIGYLAKQSVSAAVDQIVRTAKWWTNIGPVSDKTSMAPSSTARQAMISRVMSVVLLEKPRGCQIFDPAVSAKAWNGKYPQIIGAITGGNFTIRLISVLGLPWLLLCGVAGFYLVALLIGDGSTFFGAHE